MEKKILRLTTLVTGIFGVGFLLLLWFLPDIQARADAYVQQRQQKKAEQWDSEMQAAMEGMTALEMMQYNTANGVGDTQAEFAEQLRLKLPDGMDAAQVEIDNDYLNQIISIHIPEVDENYLYEYPMIGRSTHIDDLSYEVGAHEGVLEIAMDSVYEVKQRADGTYFYLDFLTPHEVYDKVIVIDAGHGGKASGAIKKGVYEKDLNLAIVLAIKDLFEESGDSTVGVYYTRTEDINPSLKARADLANHVEADLFVSVHNNSTTSGKMSGITGTQVMYDETKADEAYGSKQFAQICLDSLVEELGSRDKGLVKGSSIYIINHAQMPVALVEVGFMTNQEELEQLCDPEYQKKAAAGIYRAIDEALEEGF